LPASTGLVRNHHRPGYRREASLSGLGQWKHFFASNSRSFKAEEIIMEMSLWDIQVPLPVLLAATATLGYMVGRWRRTGELCPRCKCELKQAMASESKPKVDGLQKI
jgi:hypothetical protein